MTNIDRDRKSRLVILAPVLSIALVSVLISVPQAARATHDVACLFLNPSDPDVCDIPGTGSDPACIGFGQCPTPSGATAAINICLGTSSGACPVPEPECTVDPSAAPVLGITIHQGVSQSGAGVVVDASAGNFPSAGPTGHLLLCIDTGTTVLEAGIADEFGNCEAEVH